MFYELRLLLVAVVWGLNYKILPLGISELGAGPFTFWRFLFSVPLMFALLIPKQQYKIAKSDMLRLAYIGVIGTSAYQWVFAAGIARTSTVEAAMLFSLSPAFAVVLNSISGRDRPKSHQVTGIVLATIGTYLIVTRTSNLELKTSHALGNALMLLAAFLWAFYAFASENLLKKYGGIRVSAWSAAFGTIGLAAVFWPEFSPNKVLALTPQATFALIFAVFGATVFGVVMFYATIPHLGSRRVMATMYLVPVIAICADFVTGTSLPDIREWVGIALVFSGVVLAKSPTLPKKLDLKLTGKLK